MKKIAILIFEVKNNLGGILPSTLNLCEGLKEIGCKPYIFHAEWKTRSFGGDGLKEIGHGLKVSVMADQRARIYANKEHTFLYKGKKAANEVRERLSEFDAVIMSTSIPSLGDKSMRDNDDWKTVLKHGKPMLSIVRDCHWDKYSLHILPYRHLFTAFMGVHPAAYESLKTMPWKIGCQVNPFDISIAQRDHEKDWGKVCITSWFKKWKHIDDIIRASPYIKPIELIVCGGGIERDYMLAAKNNPNSDGKGRGYELKVAYYSWKKDDPSVKKSWIGKSIWGVAEEHGNFYYSGFMLSKQLSALQSECGGLIDPSYHYEWGEHFNRVMIEAMLHKSIPFVRPFGISDNKNGDGKVFTPENAVMIPEDASPKEIGEIVRDTMLDKSLKRDILRANEKKLKMFDRKVVAQEYIDVLKGKSGGLFGIHEGRLDERVKARMDKFGVRIRFPRFLFPRLRRNNG